MNTKHYSDTPGVWDIGILASILTPDEMAEAERDGFDAYFSHGNWGTEENPPRFTDEQWELICQMSNATP